MEIGCGSAYVITSLALILAEEANGAYFVATDINPHAVTVTYKTLEAHGVHAELLITNIASGLERRLTRSVDIMVVNPLMCQTPEDEVGCDGITSAWAGGENGRGQLIKYFLLQTSFYQIGVGCTVTANEPSEICLDMRRKGYSSHIILQRSTEEESLHIVKFWSDPELEVNETKVLKKTGHGTVIGQLLLKFLRYHS